MPIKMPVRKNALDDVIDTAIAELKSHDVGTQSYSVALDQLEQLYSIRNGTKPDRISRDTLLIVAGNLLGIIVIVGYEQKHVVASKALNFVLKSK